MLADDRVLLKLVIGKILWILNPVIRRRRIGQLPVHKSRLAENMFKNVKTEEVRELEF